MSFVLSRPNIANKWAIRVGWFLSGLIIILNIHFSAVVIMTMGAENGIQKIGFWEVALSTYIPATGVTVFCFLAVGFLSHPMGIPLALEQIQSIRKQSTSRLATLFGYLVTITVLTGLIAGLWMCYRFDFSTTSSFMGTGAYPLFDHRQIPTWIFIIGPELIMLFINAVGAISGGKSGSRGNKAPRGGQMGGNPRVVNGGKSASVKIPQQGAVKIPNGQGGKKQSGGGQQPPWASL